MSRFHTMRDLIKIVETSTQGSSQGILVVVHPGSACGSANNHLGKPDASAARDALTNAIAGWRGGMVIVDGTLSDELPYFGRLNGAITQGLLRAKSQGLVAKRIFACDDATADWPKKVAATIKRLKLPPETAFVLTGAWYRRANDYGCVNATQKVLTALGFKAAIDDSAVEDPDDEIDDQASQEPNAKMGGRPKSVTESANLPPIRFVPNDSTELAPTSAAEFKRRTGEIVCRERWRSNQHILNHEIGHALLDHVQPPMWAAAFEDDPEAWREFLSTTVAASFQKRDQIAADWIDRPMAYDWVEIGPDLYMLDRAGRLDAVPRLAGILHRFIA